MFRQMRVVVNMSITVQQHEEHHLDQHGIHLFTRTTCIHCKRMKDTHNAERKHASENKLVLHTPRIFEHNEKNVISGIELKSNGFERIMGFPTICFSDGKGKPMEYTGARDLASLTEAFNKFIVQSS
jgi:thioredoxin-related protein